MEGGGKMVRSIVFKGIALGKIGRMLSRVGMVVVLCCCRL